MTKQILKFVALKNVDFVRSCGCEKVAKLYKDCKESNFEQYVPLLNTTTIETALGQKDS